MMYEWQPRSLLDQTPNPYRVSPAVQSYLDNYQAVNDAWKASYAPVEPVVRTPGLLGVDVAAPVVGSNPLPYSTTATNGLLSERGGNGDRDRADPSGASVSATGHDVSDFDSPGSPMGYMDFAEQNFSPWGLAISPTATVGKALIGGLIDYGQARSFQNEVANRLGSGWSGALGFDGFSQGAMAAAAQQANAQMAENNAQNNRSGMASRAQGVKGGQLSRDMADRVSRNNDRDRDINNGGFGARDRDNDDGLDGGFGRW